MIDLPPVPRQFPARWGEIAELPWTDELRNVGLLIAARVPAPTT